MQVIRIAILTVATPLLMNTINPGLAVLLVVGIMLPVVCSVSNRKSA